MPAARRVFAAGAAVAVTPLLLAACGGSNNYNTDMSSLARAVEHASHGRLVRVTCAGVVPYERQKQIKARSHIKSEYRYHCHGETTGPGAPQAVNKVIRVSLNGKHWH
jgi:hypothetical protein